MQPKIDKDDAKTSQARSRFTILELMTFLAILGVLLTWVLNRFFA